MFIFAGLGALCGVWELFAFPSLPAARLLIMALLALLLIFAASGFGLLFIPMEMLLFGRYFQLLIQDPCPIPPVGFRLLNVSLLYPLFLFISVFLAACYGLGASSALRCALLYGSPSARSRYQRQLSAAALCSLFALANVFYFT